jgi:hypothetical protein
MKSVAFDVVIVPPQTEGSDALVSNGDEKLAPDMPIAFASKTNSGEALRTTAITSDESVPLALADQIAVLRMLPRNAATTCVKVRALAESVTDVTGTLPEAASRAIPTGIISLVWAVVRPGSVSVEPDAPSLLATFPSGASKPPPPPAGGSIAPRLKKPRAETRLSETERRHSWKTPARRRSDKVPGTSRSSVAFQLSRFVVHHLTHYANVPTNDLLGICALRCGCYRTGFAYCDGPAPVPSVRGHFFDRYAHPVSFGLQY